ncbi:MAG TPA: ATP-binding protein [Chitinophagaceae bacterium]|nr:ATP-binding protein [Chitinophagaceae bacterium]
MKKIITIVVLLFETIITNAQGLDIDSLRNLLAVAREDTTRILVSTQLTNELARSDPDSAIPLAQEGLKLARQIHFLKGEVEQSTSLAVAWRTKGDYSTAIKLLLSNINYVDASNDIELKGKYYAELGGTYRDQGDYEEALKYVNKSIGLREQYMRRFPQKPCWTCRAIYTGLASIYLEKHQLDSAQKYIHIAFSYPPFPKLEGVNAAGFALAGRIQTELKNYDSALYFFRQSIQRFQQVKQTLKGLAVAYNYIAAVFDDMSRRDSAIFYLHKSLGVSRSKNFAMEILEANVLLSKIYESYNTDSALYYYKQTMIARDTLYNQEKQRQISSYKFNLDFEEQEVENAQAQYKSRVKIYGLLAAAVVFLALGVILWRNNVNRKKAYALLQEQKKETDSQKAKVEQTLDELKAAQSQLIQSAKMASLGELTAGIAHEIQNPLNFVNNFSEVNDELLKELKTEAEKGNLEEVKAIANDIAFNSEKINHHGRRADSIVKGMLQHSRTSSGQKEPTDINALTDEYLRLAYHGMRAKDKSFKAIIKTDLDDSIGKINIIPQDIGRVILNLINNAFYAVDEKKKQVVDGYEPTVSVSTKKANGKVEIQVGDNGNGIPQKVLDKIFQPFFTTKPTGQGTGLGLSLAYDIVKAHGGELEVETKEGDGSEFIIRLS